MLSVRITKTICLLLVSLSCKSQDSYFANNYIPYKMIPAIDSILVQKLDSLNEDVIGNLCVDLKVNCPKEYNEPIYHVNLNYLENMRIDTVHFFHYLARNSNHYYISKSKKYKIPVVFGRIESIFKYDYEKFPLSKIDSPYAILLGIDVMYNEEIEVWNNEPIPDWALKKH